MLALDLGLGLDLDLADLGLDEGTDDLDMEQTIIERGASDLDALGQHEGALELAGGDTAVQIQTLPLLGLLAADDELRVLDLDRQVIHGETGNRQGNAQAVFAELLDVVGRIAIRRGLGHPIERPFEVVEAQQKGRTEQG